MTYRKRFYTEDEWREISYDQALQTVLGTYKNSPQVRSMLTIGNTIRYRYSEISVTDDNGFTAMAGLYNLVPDEFLDDKYAEEDNYEEGESNR